MVEIKNLTRQKVKHGLIAKKAQEVLLGEKADNWDISICLVSCAKIKNLNKKFRGKNEPTDVLSFSGLGIKGVKEKIGEIFICPQMIAKNEIDWAIVHSVLHLLGYDHEKTAKEAEKMRQKEQIYLK